MSRASRCRWRSATGPRAIHDGGAGLRPQGQADLPFLSGRCQGPWPAGYLASLKAKEPEIIFDPATLHTKEDWIAAGKIVLESETQFRPAPEMPDAGRPTSGGERRPLAPFNPVYSYVIREKGELEGGINSCAGCHTRVMPDGAFFQGGQGSQDPPATTADVTRLHFAPLPPRGDTLAA